MGPATRVMSLRDGTKKMSKSEPSDMSRINMTDDADTIAKKIQQAKTDPHPLPTSEAELENAPRGRQPRRHLRRARRQDARPQVLAEFGGAQFSTFKKALAELAVSRIGPGQRRDERACWPTRPRSTASWPTAPRKARAIAAPDHGQGQGYRGFPALVNDFRDRSAKAGAARLQARRHVHVYCWRQQSRGSMRHG